MRSVNVPPTSTPSRFTAVPLSGLENDLAELLAALHHRHRLARLFERERRVHERCDPTARSERDALLELLARVHKGADDALLRAEEGDDVEADDFPRVGSAGDHPPVLRERVESLLEEVAADVLVGEVGAEPVRYAEDLFDDVLRPVVDPVIHAELGGTYELVVRARAADHVRAGEVRKLDGSRADAASDGIDEDALARPESAAGEEHVPRRREGDL